MMERGKEYCSFCFRGVSELKHLFMGDGNESAICDECLCRGAEKYRTILAGYMEYDSWLTPISPQPQEKI